MLCIGRDRPAGPTAMTDCTADRTEPWTDAKDTWLGASPWRAAAPTPDEARRPTPSASGPGCEARAPERAAVADPAAYTEIHFAHG
jgi:hypothetical protein